MPQLSVGSLGFALLVLAGIGVVCSLAQVDKRECNHPGPKPYSQLRTRTGQRKCSSQGSPCTPASTLCCGNMGCYDYDGGRCDPPRENCICRNLNFMVDW